MEILSAFKTYYATAELEAVTDPNIVFNLRAKLDASGHYDDFEVNRVVQVELNPKSRQGDLIAALEPVADRLLKRFKSAQVDLTTATARSDAPAAQEAKDAMNALTLFKADMGAFQRMYVFLSQIFDYGNTEIEKRAIFYKRLIPLLEFGREREGVDTSMLLLTHHRLRDQGRRQLPLGEGESPKLQPITEAGGGAVQEKERARLAEIIARVNDLFQGVSDNDGLVYADNVIKGKLMESETLAQQAANNSKEQFAQSPDLAKAIMDAIMDALLAHTTMSTQALNSEKVRAGLKDVLLGPGKLYEALRERGGGAGAN